MSYDSIPTEGPVIVTHNGRRFHVRMATPDDAFGFLLKWQGQSVHYAMTYDGYRIVQVPADRWSELEASDYRGTASQCFRHDHPAQIYPKSERALVRENCGACCLEGYDSDLERVAKGPEGPNYGGWARLYVEAGRTIPAIWRGAFNAELSSDNTAYADALALSVATFGVKFTDDAMVTR